MTSLNLSDITLHVVSLNFTQKVVQELYNNHSTGRTGMAKWTPGDCGIRYREHSTKTTGVGRMKRPLRYYAAVYKWQGKAVTDAYGWEGADFRNYDDVLETAIALRQNRRYKKPPFTLRERLDQREEELPGH